MRGSVERSPLRKSWSPTRDFTQSISPSYYSGAPLNMTRYSPWITAPMPYGEEKELVHVLKDLMNIETDLENAKCDLAVKSDFNLVDCFRIFDPTGRGWCSFEDFRDGLYRLGIAPPITDL